MSFGSISDNEAKDLIHAWSKNPKEITHPRPTWIGTLISRWTDTETKRSKPNPVSTRDLQDMIGKVKDVVDAHPNLLNTEGCVKDLLQLLSKVKKISEKTTEADPTHEARRTVTATILELQNNVLTQSFTEKDKATTQLKKEQLQKRSKILEEHITEENVLNLLSKGLQTKNASLIQGAFDFLKHNRLPGMAFDSSKGLTFIEARLNQIAEQAKGDNKTIDLQNAVSYFLAAACLEEDKESILLLMKFAHDHKLDLESIVKQNPEISFAPIFDQREGSDIQLQIQDAPRPLLCNVHKEILSARSSFFKSQFGSEWMKKNDSQAIDPGEFQAAEVKDFLREVYAGKTEINGNNVAFLLAAANYYGVDSLKDACDQWLCDHIDLNTQLEEALDFVTKMGCTELQKLVSAPRLISEIVKHPENEGLRRNIVNYFEVFGHTITEFDCTELPEEVTDLIDDKTVAILNKCPNLTSLDLTECSISDEGIKTLTENCKALVAIKIGNCPGITKASILHIAKTYPNLESLDISDCETLNDQTVKELAQKCPKLISLNIANCTNITDASISAIAQGCPNLTYLDMSECLNRKELQERNLRNITSQSLVALGLHAKNLIELNLSDCFAGYSSAFKQNFGFGQTNSLVEIAKGCRKLQKIKLEGCEIFSHVIEDFIANSKSLKVIRLPKEMDYTPALKEKLAHMKAKNAANS